MVISFNSGEDRIVKRFFTIQMQKGSGKIVGDKPTVSSEDEIRSNPRARSAKMRVIEKI